MQSARISDSQECSKHSYCPHLHFKRCRKERSSRIPYTSRALKEIDLTFLGNLTTRNIPTLALESYCADPVLPDQEDTNFSKNFYLQNCPENYQLRNTLLADTEQSLAKNNAYSLAAGATEEYNKFAKRREEYLQNARKRADVAYNNFRHQKQTERTRAKAEAAKWITDYFRKVQQLINRIFGRNNLQNEDPNIKDKQFLKEHQEKDSKALSQLKIRDPQAALGILESLRALLLRKKIQLQQQRVQQQHNKSVSASYIDASSASNTSQQNLSGVSFMSATTNATKQENEAHFAEKFCDFEVLMKKWGKSNVEQVRNTLRVMLSRDLINKAEGEQMRKRKKAKERDEFLRKQMQKMGHVQAKREGGKKGNRKANQKSRQSSKKMVAKQEQEKPTIFFNDPLSGEERAVKSTLLRGGIFDSVGNIYQRNRNYSQLFRQRGERSLCDISFKQSPPHKQLLTTRPNLH